MTPPALQYVRVQVERRFFAEALYFGALALAQERSTQLHLYLGLACCGSCAGVADVQRILWGKPAPTGSRPLAGNATRLVYEGFFHLLEAARGGVRIPEELAQVGAGILDDLEWYLHEDFKGFALPGRRHSLKSAGAGAAVLVHRLLPNAPPLADDSRALWAEQLVDEELRQTGGDADFYRSFPARNPL